jgi:hypothetical protein
MMAGLLGLIPGVGAMYNEQYAKGIVHLVIFALLVSLTSDMNGIFGLFIGGWVIYMAIEAYHTARARRDGTPLPNPFGLNDLSERLGFGRAWPGAGPAVDPTANQGPTPPPAAGAAPNVPPANPYAPPYSYTYVPPVASWGMPQAPPPPTAPPAPGFIDPNLPVHRRFPSGAIWLIGLGVFFLLANSSFFGILHARVVMPLLLIGFGVWLFVRKMTSDGLSIENDGTPLYHWRLSRAINSAMWVVLTGVIWLLAALHILSWGRSWPIYIIALGLVMFFRRTINPSYGYGYPPPPATPPPPSPGATTTDLVPSDPHTPSASNDQEGR